MDTIEKLINALIRFRARIYYSLPETECDCPICKDLREVDELYDKYQAEKDLLAKTQDWHEHGMIAPSCVGCPTAEAVIAKDRCVRVRRDRLIKILPYSCGDCRLTLDCEVPIVTENNLYDLGGRTVTTDKEACIAHHIAFLTGADNE